MVNCVSCRTVIDDDARFCRTCGAQQPPRPAGQPQPPTMPFMQPPSVVLYGSTYGGRTEGMAVASLILGIAGLVIGLFIPLICSILAIVFGHVGKSRIKADPSLGGEGMATAGLVLGWIGVALVMLFLVFIFVPFLAYD